MGSVNIYSSNGANKASVQYEGSSDVTVNADHLTGTTSNVQTQLDAKPTTADLATKANITINATAPSSPSNGDFWYDTTFNSVKHWNGTEWVQMSNKFDASGGTETTYTLGGVNYKVHTFTTSGTFTPVTPGSVDILLVGGGGGGGRGFNRSACGGGGGAGAMRVHQGISVTSQEYTITVGAGGAGGFEGSGSLGRSAPSNGDGQFGGDTVALGMVASGGGGGSCYEDRPGFTNGNASAGGAGGAGGLQGSAGTSIALGGAYGNNGGLEGGTGQSNDSTSAGGGGGAGGNGGNGSANSQGGAGGVGGQNEFQTGSIQYYAGGGGGGSSQSPGASGGNGGGGSAGADESAGNPGAANTGGGGGGASSRTVNNNGGNGGSGIVIIRYPI